MTALIIGATGATGKELVKALLNDNHYDEIHLFGRHESSIKNPKIVNHIVDFDKPENWENLVKGDVAFSCMGTTLKDAGSKEAQRKVDFNYQLNFAKSAIKNNVGKFILVSSYGADSGSSVFYSKMKGELEDEIKKLNFTKTVFFQPGMLERPESERFAEVWGVKIIKLLNKIGILKKYKPLLTSDLADAMVKISTSEKKGLQIVKLAEISKLV